jgi:hypothetical protein
MQQSEVEKAELRRMIEALATPPISAEGCSDTLETRLANCISACINEPLFKGFLGGDGRIPMEVRLSFFRPEIADRATELLEEVGR